MFERRAVILGAVLALSAGSLAGGEGMWTFDNPPAKLLKEQFDFTPDADWLDRLRPLRSVVAGAGLLEAGVAAAVPSHLIRSGNRLPPGPYQPLISAHIDACLLGVESASPRFVL